MTTDFAERLGRVRERVAAASLRAGRSPDEITLVAVTKKQSTQTVERSVNEGLRDLGENYVQEAAFKRAALASRGCTWHLIGHLQSNKAKVAVEIFDLIQSVDSVRLAHQIARYAELSGKVQRVLLQVHLGEEATKTGLPPDCVADAAQEVLCISGLHLQGLMGVAPQGEDARHHFRLLRRLFDQLPKAAREVLSMGMTGDFETAIEEGATMLRLGTALFGERTAGQVAETHH